jgi:hypothetical protein
VIGEVGVIGFGLKASGGKRFWYGQIEGGGDDAGDTPGNDSRNQEDANKLYVGLLIMLIFSEALAL